MAYTEQRQADEGKTTEPETGRATAQRTSLQIFE